MTRSRDDIVRELTRHCGDGRLTLDELEERIQEAYAATTDAELEHALRELPAIAEPEPTPPPASLRPPRAEIPTVPLPARTPHHPRKHEQPEWEKALGTLFAIGGFVLLFNGMFLLALICWFVLPGLVLKNRGRG